MIVHVTVVRHAHVAHHYVPVHLNFILRSDNNMVPFVIRLPYALTLLVDMRLGCLNVYGILLHVGGDGRGGWRYHDSFGRHWDPPQAG